MVTKAKNKSGKGLLIYIGIILTLAILLLCALWIILGHYDVKTEQVTVEKSVNRKLEAFQTFLEGSTSEYWTDLWFQSHPDSLDDPDKVKDYMQERFFEEEVSCWRSVKSTADSPVYVIKSGDEPLAEVFLEEKKGEWAVKEAVLQISGKKEGSVTVPAGCRVFCNGTEIDEDRITERAADLFFIEEYMDTRIDPQLWNTWTVTDLLAEPELTVEAPAGKTLDVIGKGKYALLCDETTRDANIGRVQAFTEKLIHFYMNGSNLTAYNAKQALNYVREGTQAEELIRSVVRGVYLGTYFEDYQLDYSCGPFVQWADNCIGCDVDYSITNIDEDQGGTLRIVLIDFGKGYEICGLSLD